MNSPMNFNNAGSEMIKQYAGCGMCGKSIGGGDKKKGGKSCVKKCEEKCEKKKSNPQAKRPLTKYQKFIKDNYDKPLYKGMKSKDIFKALGAEWRKIK